MASLTGNPVGREAGVVLFPVPELPPGSRFPLGRFPVPDRPPLPTRARASHVPEPTLSIPTRPPDPPIPTPPATANDRRPTTSRPTPPPLDHAPHNPFPIPVPDSRRATQTCTLRNSARCGFPGGQLVDSGTTQPEALPACGGRSAHRRRRRRHGHSDPARASLGDTEEIGDDFRVTRRRIHQIRGK